MMPWNSSLKFIYPVRFLSINIPDYKNLLGGPTNDERCKDSDKHPKYLKKCLPDDKMLDILRDKTLLKRKFNTGGIYLSNFRKKIGKREHAGYKPLLRFPIIFQKGYIQNTYIVLPYIKNI